MQLYKQQIIILAICCLWNAFGNAQHTIMAEVAPAGLAP